MIQTSSGNSHQRMMQFRFSSKQYDHQCGPDLETRGPFDVHTNAYFNEVEYPSDVSEVSTCTLDANPDHSQRVSQQEASISRRRLMQLEEELAAYRGQVIGWRNRCCVAEDALQNRQKDQERLLIDVGVLKQRLEAMQRTTESQEISIRSLSNKIEIMSSLALALSAISICLILSGGGMHK